jgi:hypothetical protein
MKESEPIEGRWHIFGIDRTPHYGKLFLDAKTGLRLEVKVAEARTEIEFLDSLSRRLGETTQIIQGFDRFNMPLRLFDCVDEGEESALGLRTIIYSVQRAVRGINDGDWASISSRGFKMGFSILNCWMHPTGPPLRMEQWNPPMKHVIADLFTFFIDVSITMKSDGARSGLWWVGMVFDEKIQVAKVCQKYRQHFALLLVLITGQRIALDEFSFGIFDDRGGWHDEREVLEAMGDDGIITRKQLPVYMRTLHADVIQSLPSILEKWFGLISDPDMKQVVNLYRAVKIHNLFISAEFLLIAQALEAYHTASRKYSSTKWDSGEFKSMLKRVRHAISVDDRKKLSDCFSHANNKSFQDKLLDILNDAPVQVNGVIKDRTHFAKSVKDNRNAHTHHVGKQSHSRRLNDYYLASLADEALVLLEMLLLRDVGAPEKAFLQIVREHTSKIRIKINSHDD